MLVIATDCRDDGLRWRGRRHDDIGPGAVRGSTPGELFDAVFAALHDGEQVAVVFTGPGVPRELGALLGELGRWRNWTVVSTTVPRWRAATSLLVRQAEPAAELDGVVDDFYAALHEPDGGDGVLSSDLVAEAGRVAGLTVDPAVPAKDIVRIGRPAAAR